MNAPTIQLEGLYEEHPAPFTLARAHNEANQERIIAFNQQLAQCLDIESLKAFAFERHHPEEMDKTELMQLFTAFRDRSAPDQMQRLYNECHNEEFTQAPMVREFLAVSFNKSQQPDEAIRVADALLADAGNPQCPYHEYVNTSEVYAAIAKAYVLKGDRDKARENYERGFYEHFDFYPGINAAYEYLAAGNVSKARQLAELTYQACLRDGGLETRDYWCTTSMLESACLIGMDQDHIQKCLDTLLSYEIKDFHKKATLEALNTRVIPALEALIAAGGHEELSGVLGNVRSVIQELGQYTPGMPKKDADQLSAEELVFKNSYSSRGISGWETEVITGNARYGGAVADIAISRFDRVEFQKLLHIPLVDLISMVGGDIRRLPEAVRKENLSLSQLQDSKQFIKCAQVLVRENYGNEQKDMECIDSVGHEANHDLPTNALYNLTGIPDPRPFYDSMDRVPDEQVPADILAMRTRRREIEAKRRSADITTNAIVEFVKGLGDCRHHGQAGLQLLFNLWQKEQTEKLHREAIRAIEGGDEIEFNEAKAKVDKILSEELRVFDVRVAAPIKMKSIYKPLRPPPPAKYFIPDDDQVNSVEDHTMTFLVGRDGHGNLNHMRFADAFYQQTYPWGDGDIDLSGVTVSGDGKLRIAGGMMRNIGADDQAVPVILEASPYAGLRTKSNPRDIGSVPYEHGLPIAGFNLEKLLGRRSQIVTNLRVVTQGYVESQTEDRLRKAAANHSFSFDQDVLVAVLSEHQGVELYSYGKPRDGFALTGVVPHWRSGFGGAYEMTHTNVPPGTMIAVGDLEDLKIDDFEALKAQLEKIDIYPTGHNGDFSGQDITQLQKWFFDRSVRDDTVNNQDKIAHAARLTKDGLGNENYTKLVEFLADEMQLFKDKTQNDTMVPADRAKRVEIVTHILDGLSKTVRYTRKDDPAKGYQVRGELGIQTPEGGKIELPLAGAHKILVLRKEKKEIPNPNGVGTHTIEQVIITPLDISMIGKTYVTADGEPLGERGVVDLAAIVTRAAQIEDQKARQTRLPDPRQVQVVATRSPETGAGRHV